MASDVKLPSWMPEGTQGRIHKLIKRGFTFNFGSTPEEARVIFGETERIRHGQFDKICIVREDGKASYAWRLRSDNPAGPSSKQAQASYDDVLDAVLRWPPLEDRP